MTERPAWAPQGIDLSVPSVSRIYDYYLGGSHNFEVDREAGRQAMAAYPGLPQVMQANRAFLRRAVRFAVAEGVTQFLDVGSGIPTFGNVHEIAQQADPRARVVYVDHDPVAVEHSRAVLAGQDRATAVAADLRSPRDILHSRQVRELLDLGRPVGLLLVAVLHFLQDHEEPGKAVAELRDALAPGSLLILTHATEQDGPIRPEAGARVRDVYRAIGSPLRTRSRSQVAAFFEGFTLVEPGLVPMNAWRPEPDGPGGPAPAGPAERAGAAGFAGVGRKR
ncbi:SAM-dependent methyltransferase [Streptomyces sp. NPDC052396]|uniref:SAM-dependent methyltransferase n=1 Tax=Streptomyces sp. NPDC052396 TaxID=3365689 RepID=UPI0037D7B55A